MDKFLELYERNKKLDAIYYNNYSKDDDKLYEKNCLEFVVELCELANESKCFKYWSKKLLNRELVLEEYADCILMCLYFFNEYNIDKIEVLDIDSSDDILVAFNRLIRMCTSLMDNYLVNKKYILEIFAYLLHLGKLLEFNENDIIDACYNKIEKNEMRLNGNY